MISKKLSGPLLGFTTLALASCSQQELPGSADGVHDGALITTTVGMSAENAIASRATPDVFGGDGKYYSWSGNSGSPSVDNIDLGKNKLTYTIGIYTKKTDGSYTLVGETQSKQEQANAEAYFNFRLIKGQTYRLVAYADYSSAAKTDLTNIDLTADRSATETKKDAYILNDELNDAFFVSENFVASEHVSAILKRPFGKLRLIARDFNVFSAGEVLQIEGIEVEYKNQHEMLATSKFNALTGEFNGTDNNKKTFTSKPVAYMQEYDDNGKAVYAAVFTMYLPANSGTPDKTGEYTPDQHADGTTVPQSWMYPFEINVKYKNKNDIKDDADNEEITKTLTRKFEIDIPVKRNWLTTVDAEYFWTDNSNIKVSIDKRFDGSIEIEPKTIYVKTEKELNDAIKKITDSDPSIGSIVLGADIDMDKYSTFAIGNPPEDGNPPKDGNLKDISITIDLNGHYIATTKQADNYYYGDNSVFNVYGWGKDVCLTINDTSKEGTGKIENLKCDDQVIAVWHGGKVVINAGTYRCWGTNAAIYAGRYKETTYPAATITINGGYFENINGMDFQHASHMPVYGGQYWYETLININNTVTNTGFDYVYLNGGTYVDFNPLNGDNVSHNDLNYWVDTQKYDVVTSTVGEHTLYTVISKGNPDYY